MDSILNELKKLQAHTLRNAEMVRLFVKVYSRKPIDFVELDKFSLRVTLHGSKSFNTK
jgi:hypothetical protein